MNEWMNEPMTSEPFVFECNKNYCYLCEVYLRTTRNLTTNWTCCFFTSWSYYIHESSLTRNRGQPFVCWNYEVDSTTTKPFVCMFETHPSQSICNPLQLEWIPMQLHRSHMDNIVKQQTRRWGSSQAANYHCVSLQQISHRHRRVSWLST